MMLKKSSNWSSQFFSFFKLSIILVGLLVVTLNPIEKDILIGIYEMVMIISDSPILDKLAAMNILLLRSALVQLILIISLGYVSFDYLRQSRFEINSNVKSAFSWIVLAMILMISTLVKAPFFNYSFTGAYATKYASHVEPAQYMKILNNPFHYQKKYIAARSSNFAGVFETFNTLPLMEWTLFSGYKLLPFSIETTTRLVTSLIGVAALIMAFLFFKQTIGSKESLWITFLIAFSAVFSLATYLTVLDSWLCLFTFSSCYFLSKSLPNKVGHIQLAGVLFGVGAAVKYSIALWLIPIALTLIWFYRTDLKDFLLKSFYYGMSAIFPLVIALTGIKYLPTNLPLSLGLLMAELIITAIILFLLARNTRSVDRIIGTVLKKPLLLLLVIPLSLLIFGLFLHITRLTQYQSDFITDISVLFYWPMYISIFNRLQFWSGQEMLIMALLGSVLIFAKSNQSEKKILASFAIGSLFYLLTASKAIYFHTYYLLIIVITLSIAAGFFIARIADASSKLLKIITILFFITLALKAAIPRTYAQLSMRKPAAETLVNYIQQNINPNDRYILAVDPYTYYEIMIKTDVTSGEITLRMADFPERIKQNELIKTLREQQISYLITNQPDLIEHPELFFIDYYRSFYTQQTRSEQIRNQPLPEVDIPLELAEQTQQLSWEDVATVAEYKIYRVSYGK